MFRCATLPWKSAGKQRSKCIENLYELFAEDREYVRMHRRARVTIPRTAISCMRRQNGNRQILAITLGIPADPFSPDISGRTIAAYFRPAAPSSVSSNQIRITIGTDRSQKISYLFADTVLFESDAAWRNLSGIPLSHGV